MDGGQSEEKGLERGTQVLEGGLLIGKEGVPAGGRDLYRPEDRSERRPLDARDVTVVGVDGAGLGVVDLEHIGESGQARDDRMPLGQLAEMGGEGQVALRV